MPSLEAIAALLCCPVCRAEAWTTSGTDAAGILGCDACGARFRCDTGVLDLGEQEQDARVAAERAAVRHAERRPSLGGINDAFDDLAHATGALRDALVALPYGDDSRYYRESGYFANVRASAPAFDFLVAHLDLEPGRRLLDLGADLTWSTCRFARRGLDCTAVDINHHLSVGRLLGDASGVTYHLVRADMRTVPFRTGTFDIVFVMSALHHNPELSGVLGNIGRVLRPGGQLAVVEPYCASAEAKASFGRDQIAAGISEQTYLLSEWHDAFAGAGLEVESLRVCESFCAVYRRRPDEGRADIRRGMDGLFEGAYRGRLGLAADPPRQVPVGSPWSVPIRVENDSRAVWCSHSQFPVSASYHLYRRTAAGDVLESWDNVRTPLPALVAPGDRVDLDLTGAPIREAGTYAVELDVVHEYVTWFRGRGLETPGRLTLQATDAGPGRS